MWPTPDKVSPLSGLPNSLSSSDHFLHTQIHAFYNPRSQLFQAVCIKFRKTRISLWDSIKRQSKNKCCIWNAITYSSTVIAHLSVAIVKLCFLSNTGAGKKQHQRTSCKYLWNSYKLAKLVSEKTSCHAASRGVWQDFFCILSCCFQTEFLVHTTLGSLCKYW